MGRSVVGGGGGMICVGAVASLMGRGGGCLEFLRIGQIHAALCVLLYILGIPTPRAASGNGAFSSRATKQVATCSPFPRRVILVPI